MYSRRRWYYPPTLIRLSYYHGKKQVSAPPPSPPVEFLNKLPSPSSNTHPYRYYVEEIIPTARALYTSLPQDVLEGVDLEVGHTLPESMFAITGAVRPSWPRWGGNPSTLRRPLGQTSLAGGGGGGSGDAGSRTSNNGSSGGGGSANNGVESMDEWKEVAGFVPGPWVVFFVERQDYLDFYASQAEALEQVVGGYGTELEDMVC